MRSCAASGTEPTGTQREVARAAGMSQDRLSRYESGAVMPSWTAFVRVLAALEKQPRIVVEPLDRDIDAAIDRLRASPSEQWLDDVAAPLSMLLYLLDGLSWAAGGPFAARLHGAPVHLPSLDVDVVLGTQDWSQLNRRALDAAVQLRHPEDGTVGAPLSPTPLREAADAGAGHLEWVGPGRTILRMRVVTRLSPDAS